MKYTKGNRRRALEYEKDLVNYWHDHKTFEKSVEQRPADNGYVFYDGPPFITGSPHHGTLLSSIVKDAVPRYWTMKGKRVERTWGWDCHGLPAEVFTEKKLGIHDKRDIGTKISLEEYIQTCRSTMVQTGDLWEKTIDRIGRWVDFKGAYKTMDTNYMESVWWAFKKLYDDGKIYEGEKVLLYCTRDATPISKAEVAMDNSYQDVTDPSVYVKLKLVGEDASLLAWTTTPWTLPANTASAVNSEAEYSEVQVGDERLIIATDLLGKVLVDEKHQSLEYSVVRTYRGQELVGKSYEPLFADRGEQAHKVWAADYVTLDDGTGIVHLAPAYGEEDYELAKSEGFPFVSVIDDNGFYDEGDWQGHYVWDANKPIAKELYERGVVWKIDYIRHSYPHCHRCGTKLMYRAHPSWFMDIEGQRAKMLEQNGNVTWFPEHIKNGRFTKTIESAPDWNLSRDRFWATAMPVWKGTDAHGNEKIKVVGSYAELKELSGVELEDYHRPWIDEVKFTIDGVEYTRIDKVLDCWFESGSMPFAQFHYPFENVEKFEQNFPGDFIVEYVGQVRAWFYYMHSISIGLFGKNAYKNVIVTGTLAGNDGRKMSKSFGNYTDPNELMDQYSADSLRLLLIASPVLNAEDFSLQDKDVSDIARKLSMVWNMYDFFTLYADVDKWESPELVNGLPTDPSKDLQNPLDTWIVSRIHEVTQEIDTNMQAYDLPNAVKPLLPLIDDASNWFVRRSRKRFWKSEDDGDKQAAYRTLHYVLVQLSVIMAPFTPFLAEELYRKLTNEESVHLLDWPEPGQIDAQVLKAMAETRQAITTGLAERATAGIKVRQPLAAVTVANAYGDGMSDNSVRSYMDIIAEELNVKQVHIERHTTGSDAHMHTVSVALDLELTPALKQEGLMREVIRNIQQARKQAGLEVDDRIDISLQSDGEELTSLLKNSDLTDVIKQETLTETINKAQQFDYETTTKVEGQQLSIGVNKHK
ncbi:MAG: isoleucine--tRNA ligase [Patescibacteria group bacterium]|nr:isoleucine--tRNA ligase [Patescibacteria group bacterium]